MQVSFDFIRRDSIHRFQCQAFVTLYFTCTCIDVNIIRLWNRAFADIRDRFCTRFKIFFKIQDFIFNQSTQGAIINIRSIQQHDGSKQNHLYPFHSGASPITYL